MTNIQLYDGFGNLVQTVKGRIESSYPVAGGNLHLAVVVTAEGKRLSQHYIRPSKH